MLYIETIQAQDWESFAIDEVVYLAVANFHLEGNYEINSVIYKWSGSQFVSFQEIGTSAACSWESFYINEEMYIVVANSRNSGTFNINSVIYKWNGTMFEQYQEIATRGAHAWHSFLIERNAFLVVANCLTGAAGFQSSITRSVIYRWNGREFVLFQEFAGEGSVDWESFEIDGISYLAVANSYNDHSYYIKSMIYSNGVIP